MLGVRRILLSLRQKCLLDWCKHEVHVHGMSSLTSSFFPFSSHHPPHPPHPFLCFSPPQSPFSLSSSSLYQEHSHDELYDFEKELDRELEGSDHFPVSCASSVTIVSEHDRHTFASPITSGGESPVIRPNSCHFWRNNFWLMMRE